ncbi:M15 family metallopeptidase [Candidatus Saccharibacteria bacterium]|nr:M15 family metallopeptidase [Candidatus Saccharibacteria bacterium]
MKKVILFVLVIAMLLTACGTSSDSEAKDAVLNDVPLGDVYLVLVNKDHILPDNWLGRIELVSDQDPWGDEVKIEKTTLEQFKKLQAALLEQGVDIRLDSVYRSVDDQIALWKSFEEEYGEDYCEKYLAAPGYSEHHTGLAVDVCMVKDGEAINDNEAMIAETELFDKVHELMPEYGFILRYPKGKEDTTGYDYEPWHLRYVGVDAAKEIAKKDITLEEYLESIDTE